ncbi:AAA family ATPase [Holdemanella porci]|uniref:AAA family ATPase n=1 Tax=Holdemanella porci TaxID=2652276 RepID=UPI00388F9971
MPLAITALKYFCEEARQYHIIVAGSLLGVSLHEGIGFPVGKVERLKMYPMTFSEFIGASGKVHLLELLESHRWEEISSLSVTFTVKVRTLVTLVMR